MSDPDKSEAIEITGKIKMLAGLCAICPFCIAARKFPESKYAKMIQKAEALCPACKAYRQVNSESSKG